MPLYTENNIGVDSGIALEDYRPTLGQALKSSWDTALATNPTKTFESFADLTGDLPDFEGMSDADIVQFSQEEIAARRMPVEEQAEYIRGSGLEGMLKPHASYTREVLDTLIEAKKEENWRNFVYDKSTAGQAFLGFGAGLAGSMVDPVNLASSLVIPGAPAKTLMQGLARAGSPLARAGVRALEGSVSGAIGAAAVEPLVYVGQQQLQADYDMYNSAMNLGFGAIMGGAIKPLAGAAGERFRKLRNQPQAWEYAPSTDETKALAKAHEEALFNAQRQTDAGADPEKLRSAVADQAATYDAWMRHLSYRQQVPVAELYKRYQLDYYTGEIFDKQALQAGELVENYRALQEEVAQVQERRNMLEQSGTLRVPDDGYDLPAAQARLEAMERQLPDALDLLRKQAAIRLADQASGTLSQPRLATDSLSGEERLAGEVEAWGKKVDEIGATAALPKQNVKMLSQTPLVMKLLDTDPNAPGTSAQGGIYVSPHVFDSKHPNIGPNELKQLPQALADPVAILDSTTHKGDLVFMTEIKDRNGATVVIPIELKTKRKGRKKEFNRVKSPYAKDFELALADNAGKIIMPDNAWFLNQLNKNARYVNGQKLREWMQLRGSNSQEGLQSKIASNSRGLKVFTETDIVKLRQQNPTKYQAANTSPASRPNALGGSNTSVMGSSGSDRARYEVWEMADLVASHDPKNQFARRDGYPASAQERPYHSATRILKPENAPTGLTGRGWLPLGFPGFGWARWERLGNYRYRPVSKKVYLAADSCKGAQGILAGFHICPGKKPLKQHGNRLLRNFLGSKRLIAKKDERKSRSYLKKANIATVH